MISQNNFSEEEQFSLKNSSKDFPGKDMNKNMKEGTKNSKNGDAILLFSLLLLMLIVFGGMAVYFFCVYRTSGLI